MAPIGSIHISDWLNKRETPRENCVNVCFGLAWREVASGKVWPILVTGSPLDDVAMYGLVQVAHAMICRLEVNRSWVIIKLADN
jgi:hypothetical protein